MRGPAARGGSTGRFRAPGLLERLGAAFARRPVTALAVVVAAWAAARAVLLLFATGFIDPEGDLKFGHLTKDLLEGLIASPSLYRPYVREGGATPFSFFAVPFFAVLGPSYLALKAAAVAFMGLAVPPWVALARRAGGPVAGLVVALLVLLPAPFYLALESSPANVPTHAGGLVFAGWAFWALYRGFGDRSLPASRAAFLCGLFAGLGVYWVLTSGPIALGLGVTALLLGVRWRHVALMVAGGAPGAFLAWWYCLAPALSGSDALFKTMASLRGQAQITAGTVVRHLFAMVTGYFPRTAAFGIDPDRLPAGGGALLAAVGAGFYALLLAALAALLLPRRGQGLAPRARRFLVLAPAVPLYLAFYLAANPLVIAPERFDLHRYFLPLLPFALLAIGFAVARLAEAPARAPRLAAGGLVAVALALGVASAVLVAASGRLPTPLRLLRGYHTGYARRIPKRPETFLRGLRLPGRMDYDFLAMGLGVSDAAEPDPRRAARRFGLPPALRLSYWEGVGSRMRSRLVAGKVTPDDVRRAALRGGRAHRRAFARGFALGTFPTFAFPGENAGLFAWLADIFADLPEATRRPILRGAAQGIGRGMLAHPEEPELPPGVPPALHGEVLAGLAVAMGRALLPWRPWPRDEPLPGLVESAAALAPQSFRRVMEQERRRQEALYRRYSARAPISGGAVRAGRGR